MRTQGGGWTLAWTRRRPSPEPDGAQAAASPEVLRVDLDAELSRWLSCDLDPVAVEAELQELIADERAR